MSKTFRQTMRELEDMIISRNTAIYYLTNQLHREYLRKGGGIPRRIMGFKRDDNGEGVVLHRRDEFGDGWCKRETFASKFEVDPLAF